MALARTTADHYLALEQRTALTQRLLALQASVEHRPLDAFHAMTLAVQADPGQYTFDRGYMMDLCKAGYLERCLAQARGTARIEPVSAATHTNLATIYSILGERERMLDHARLSGRFGGDLGDYFEAQSLLSDGDWDAAAERLSEAMRQVGVSSGWVGPFVDALADPATVETAIAAMQAVDDASRRWLDLFYLEFTALGELDLAFAATQTLIEERFQTWNLYVWSSQMRVYRDDPRFIEAMRSMGLLDAWAALGLPDACTGVTPEPFCRRIPSTSDTP